VASSSSVLYFKKYMPDDWFQRIAEMTNILGCCFVFGPYDATPRPTTDHIRCGLTGYSVISDSRVQAECRLVFKIICKYAVEQCIFIYSSDERQFSACIL
jgi:hypothetical protein